MVWEMLAGIATFGAFLFGFYGLLRADIGKLGDRMDRMNDKLSDVSERLAQLEAKETR